jgi:alkylation response protein AidB-like acyl-CoA dehydrogenase
MPVNTETFGDLVPYGDPSWYRNYNRRARRSATKRAAPRPPVARAVTRRCTPPHVRSPYYSASHRAFRAKVRAFVDAEVTPHCDAWDRTKSIPRELFVKAYQAGLLPGVVGPPWPVAYAGPAPEVRDAAATRAAHAAMQRASMERLRASASAAG